MLKKKLSIITAMLIAASAPITWNATAQESPELPPTPEVQKAPVGTLQLTDEQKTHLKNILSEEQYQKLVRFDESKKDFIMKKRAMDARQKKIGFAKKGGFAHAKKGRAFRNHSAPDQPCAMVRQGRDFPGKMMAKNHGPKMKGQWNDPMNDSFKGPGSQRNGFGQKGRSFRNHSAPDQPCDQFCKERDFPGKMMGKNHEPMMRGLKNRLMDDSFRGQNGPRKMAAKAHPNHGLQMSGNTFHPKNRGMERKMKRG